jgi:choline kinase
MKHGFINLMIALAVLGAMIGIQQLDASDFETAEKRQRRVESFAVQTCLRVYGIESSVEHDEDGSLVCRSRRGEVMKFKDSK